MALDPPTSRSVDHLQQSALAPTTLRRYRLASAAYLHWAERTVMNPADHETLLVFLYARRDLAHSTLRLDVDAIRWRCTGRADPTAHPEITAFLAAHGRAAGHAPRPENTSAVLDTSGVVTLLTAPWPANATGGDLLVARGVVCLRLLAAHGTSAALTQLNRLKRCAVTFTDDTATVAGGDDLPTLTFAAEASDRCPVAALRTCRAAAAQAGTDRLLGWSVDQDGQPRPMQRGLDNLRSGLHGALRRAGHDAGLHPAALSGSQLEHLLGHVDRSRRLELRTRAFIAVSFNTAARHDDLTRVRLPLARSSAGYELHVPRSKSDPGGAGHHLQVDHVPGHPPACPACHLRRWLDELPDGGPLLCALGAGGRLRDTSVAVEEANDAIRRLARSATLALHGRRLGTHTFRKSHCSIRAAAGERPEDIAATTHQDPAVLFRHYVEPLDRLGGQAQLRV